MKSVLAAGVLFLLTAGSAAPAQTPIPTQPPTNPQIAQTLDLNAILSQIQQATSSANAVPGMISAVQTNKGSVTTSFKLYHNLNVVYENLIYLADVTGSLGKREEFEPLNSDIVALEAARKNLSAYIEDAAVKREAANRQ